MKVLIEIPDSVYENARNGMLDELQSTLICGSVVEGKPLPKDATNGDVIQTLWNVKTWMYDDDTICVEYEEIMAIKLYPLSWWNAPCKERKEMSNGQ